MPQVYADSGKLLSCYLFRVVDRTGAQLQRLAKFLQTKQPFFQQLQPEVVRDVSLSRVLWCQAKHIFQSSWLLQVARFLLYDHISAGTILMRQGDKGDHMYIILSGQANVHIANNKSFKNVVHAIQHTRFLAKLASSSKVQVDTDAKPPPVVATPSLSASAAKQAGNADPVREDATHAELPKRLSRFGQDTHAAAVAASAHVEADSEQHGDDKQHDSSVSTPAMTSQPTQPTNHKLVKAKQGLGRLVNTAAEFVKGANLTMAQFAVSESRCWMLSSCPSTFCSLHSMEWSLSHECMHICTMASCS